uniref:Uncharacterized protein n=1 Tax=Cacopsylla melanoneura TaxID=428564 RepID=A0A8D8LID5_9HEMI
MPSLFPHQHEASLFSSSCHIANFTSLLALPWLQYSRARRLPVSFASDDAVSDFQRARISRSQCDVCNGQNDASTPEFELDYQQRRNDGTNEPRVLEKLRSSGFTRIDENAVVTCEEWNGHTFGHKGTKELHRCSIR